MKRIFYFISCLAVLCSIIACMGSPKEHGELTSSIDSILLDKEATVGVAVLTPQGKLIIVNDTVSYPLMSVFKFHIALAVLDKMNRQNTPLDTLLFIPKHQLRPNTYSPLREAKFGQDFNISMAELLEYSVSHSDNNACDILIEYAGGADVINQYIKGLGIANTTIAVTEEEMGREQGNARMNHAFPSAVAQLMKLFVEQPLFDEVYKEFLIQTMIKTSTGKDKLKALLPAEAVVGHKTGSSNRTDAGIKIADNDAGFVRLPDGQIYYIVVFVKDSGEEDAVNARIIAEVSRKVYEYIERGLSQ